MAVIKAKNVKLKFFNEFSSDVEKSVNKWLRDNPHANIVKIKQQTNRSLIYISVWYVEG